ncbi:hypothetical protein NB311A_00560 [Nitrobacter sp. Nb-311A]|nr:hypothetical protein NB311A_00560 [Nitrobacter sp. Nb-311A]
MVGYDLWQEKRVAKQKMKQAPIAVSDK